MTGEYGFLAWFEVKALLQKPTTKVGGWVVFGGGGIYQRPPRQPQPVAVPSCSPQPSAVTPSNATLFRPPTTQVVVSQEAKAAYLVEGNQWVSFDLPQTLYMKLLAARELGLGGLMVRPRYFSFFFFFFV